MKSILTTIFLAVSAGSSLASGTTVDYQVNGRTYEGFYVSPAQDAPLVVIVHDWDGLTDYEVTRAGMLAELGYAVFAVDLFGKGVRPTDNAERRKLTGELYKDRAKMRTLLQGGIEAAKAQGGNVGNAVLMGYCFGGAAVLELARSGADMKGFVSFHGGLTTPAGQDYSKAKGQFLILHGTADTSVTMQDFANLAMELEKSGVAHEMITYSGAPHAFTVFGTDRYRADADHKSWRRFVEYLQATLR